MKLKCDWDCCKHYNVETKYCDNPDEVVLKTKKVNTIAHNSKTQRISVNELELFECESFVSYEETEGI